MKGQQQGYILLPVVLLITLVAAVAFMLNNEAVLDSGITHSKAESAQAEYTAQAGLKHALWQVEQAGCGPYTDISSEPLGLNSYSATITPNNVGGTISTIIVPVTDDAWIDQGNDTSNYGNDDLLRLGGSFTGGNYKRPYYRFDIENAGIAPGAIIVSAVARFYVIKFEHNQPVTVHRVTADWDEATVSWDNINSSLDSSPAASIPNGTPQDQFVDVNLTGLVQSWVNGAEQNYGITLAPSIFNVGETSEYTSKEYGNASQRPELVIKVADGSLSNRADISSTGMLANGVSRTVTRSDIKLTQPPSSVVWQPGAVLEDAFIWAGAHEGKNFGVSPILNIKSDRNVLIRFALEALPPGARITDARLGLYLEDGGGVDNGVLDLHAISRSWVEGIYDDEAPPAGGGVTYQSYDGQTNWATFGGDYDAAVIDSVLLPSMIPGWYEWNVTAQIQDWLDGSANYGFLLREGGGDAGDIDFVSSDNTATPEYHPRLSITLACECGVTCQIPQGNGNLLLVVGDDVTLSASDAKKKALFEAWGYSVNLLDDDAAQPVFDNSLNNNAVAYVSASSSDAVLADKLVNTIRGVVNENSGQNDNLGISSTGAQVVNDSIAIIDNSHYITALFPAGVIPLGLAPMEGLAATGSPAPGLQTLGERSGSKSLALIDSGGVMQSGGNAAGRRVNVPVGSSSGFNWDYFNNNGRLIVQRALQWASNIITGSVNIIIISTEDDAELGGLSYLLTDLAEYTLQTDSATLYLDSVAAGLSENIDALHVLANDHIIFSTKDDATFAGLSFSKEDLVEYDPVAGTATMYLEADVHFDSKEDIISVHILDSGNVVLSTDGDATLGGVNFSELDLVEYDRSTGTASTFFDGDATTLSEKITSVHILSNGHIVLSAADDTSLGGLSFGADELIEYDPVADTATLYFDGSTRFSTTDEIITSLHIGAGSGEVAFTVPLAHWKLDETSGTDAIDSVGGHDGTLTNGPGWTGGQVDGALDFDGSNDYIEVPHDDNLSLTETMTFISWVNASSYGAGYQTILTKDTTGAATNYWFGTWQQDLVFGFFAGGTFREVFTSGLNLQAGTWYQLAASFDNASDEVRLYVNGSMVHTGALAFSPTAVNADLSIGKSRDGEYWPGLLDDVRIYDRVLTDLEIADLYNVGGGGGGPPPPPPLDGVIYEAFSETKLGSNGTSMSVSKPGGTAAGDLLVAAIVTDGKQGDAGILPPAGWTLVDHGMQKEKVTLGVWWKLAGSSEPANYSFSWPEDEEAYGTIMRFSGIDPVNPINIFASGGGKSSSPTSPAVVTTVPDATILRIGGFNGEDINAGAPGLSGHNAIDMDSSSSSKNSASGGAGYKLQPTAGNSGTSTFTLTKNKEYRAVTIGIAPAP